MLSEAELRRLAAIEAQLRSEDPGYVRHFEERRPSVLTPERLNRRAMRILVTAAAVACIGVAVDSLGTVLVAVAAIVAVGVWVAHRRPASA